MPSKVQANVLHIPHKNVTFHECTTAQKILTFMHYSIHLKGGRNAEKCQIWSCCTFKERLLFALIGGGFDGRKSPRLSIQTWRMPNNLEKQSCVALPIA